MPFFRVRKALVGPACRSQRREFSGKRFVHVIVIKVKYLKVALDTVHGGTEVQMTDVVGDKTHHEQIRDAGASIVKINKIIGGGRGRRPNRVMPWLSW